MILVRHIPECRCGCTLKTPLRTTVGERPPLGPKVGDRKFHHHGKCSWGCPSEASRGGIHHEPTSGKVVTNQFWHFQRRNEIKGQKNDPNCVQKVGGNVRLLILSCSILMFTRSWRQAARSSCNLACISNFLCSNCFFSAASRSSSSRRCWRCC